MFTADVVWSCLQNEEAVQSTFESILKHNVCGKIFIESSTVGPDLTNSLAERILEEGGEFVAAPCMCPCLQLWKEVNADFLVMGEPSMIGHMIVTSIPAGTHESVSQIRPLLSQLFVAPILITSHKS